MIEIAISFKLVTLAQYKDLTQNGESPLTAQMIKSRKCVEALFAMYICSPSLKTKAKDSRYMKNS